MLCFQFPCEDVQPGKGGTKHYHQVLHNIYSMAKPAIHCLACRGAMKRISGLIYEETHRVLKIFLDAITYAKHIKGRLTIMDMVCALKCHGCILYPFSI